MATINQGVSTLIPAYGIPKALGVGGAGKTSHQQGSYNAGTNPDQRINDILQKIQSGAGVGTFNEGQLNAAADAYKGLKADLDAGNLSQTDFVKITDAFVPQMKNFADQMASTGQAGGKAVGNSLSILNDALNNTQIYKSGIQYLGRDLTPGEVAQALPYFGGPNGITNGNAFLANLAQQYKANPTLDPGSKINTTKPADVQSQVSQQFQSVLGRAPTADELDHFTQAIQSNQTDAYGLGNFLKQMPEYTNAQDATFRSGVNDELTNYDTTEFNKEKSGIMADYAQRGMSPGSSPSLDYALTDLMGKIASNRSAYLTQLSASQYGGNKDLAVGNYQNTLNQMYGQNQQNQQNQSNLSNALLNRGFQGQDYQTQMNDYMNYLDSQPKQQNGSLLGSSLMGAGAGASVGGGWGALAGAGLGAYSYLNQR